MIYMYSNSNINREILKISLRISTSRPLAVQIRESMNEAFTMQ